MSISTVTASRILQGRLKAELGEGNYLAFEKFPNSGLIKVYYLLAAIFRSYPVVIFKQKLFFSSIKRIIEKTRKCCDEHFYYLDVFLRS